MRTRFRLAAGSLLVGFLLLFQTGLAFGHGSFHERIDYLTKALEQTPADPILRFELANLHGLHGDMELALEVGRLGRAPACRPQRRRRQSRRGGGG